MSRRTADVSSAAGARESFIATNFRPGPPACGSGRSVVARVPDGAPERLAGVEEAAGEASPGRRAVPGRISGLNCTETEGTTASGRPDAAAQGFMLTVTLNGFVANVPKAGSSAQ